MYNITKFCKCNLSIFTVNQKYKTNLSSIQTLFLIDMHTTQKDSVLEFPSHNYDLIVAFMSVQHKHILSDMIWFLNTKLNFSTIVELLFMETLFEWATTRVANWTRLYAYSQKSVSVRSIITQLLSNQLSLAIKVLMRKMKHAIYKCCRVF